MSEIEPLKEKTYTLSHLQLEILDLIRRVRFQLQRPAHAEGMNNEEFIDEFLEPFEMKILADREFLRMARKRKRGGA